MTDVRRPEREIAALSPAELAELRRWYAECDASAWDRADGDGRRGGSVGSAGGRGDHRVSRGPLAPSLRHRASSRFWRACDALQEAVRLLADRSFELRNADPQHSSLHLERIGRFRSVRVGLHYRAPGVDVEDGVRWFWIGTHAGHDALVG